MCACVPSCLKDYGLAQSNQANHMLNELRDMVDGLSNHQGLLSLGNRELRELDLLLERSMDTWVVLYLIVPNQGFLRK